jgi:hypothetical protein
MIVLLNENNKLSVEVFSKFLLEQFREYFNFPNGYFTINDFDNGIKLIEENYLFLYWVKSKTFATNIYNDEDGDFLNSDSDTTYFDTPFEEISNKLKEHNFSEDFIKNAILHADDNLHFENFYYGDSEKYGYIKINIE